MFSHPRTSAIFHLPDRRQYRVVSHAPSDGRASFTLTSSDGKSLRLSVEGLPNLSLPPEDEPADNTPWARAGRMGKVVFGEPAADVLLTGLYAAIYALFEVLYPQHEAFRVELDIRPQYQSLIRDMLRDGLAYLVQPPGATGSSASGTTAKLQPILLLSRAAFYQGAGSSPYIWLTNEDYYPHNIVLPPIFNRTLVTGQAGSQYTLHTSVLRPPIFSSEYAPPPEPIYTRFIPWLNQYLTFTPLHLPKVDETIDDSVPRHLQLFCEWQNSDRVNRMWRQRDSLEGHRRYLERVRDSESSLGLVGSFDGVEFGWFEIYWVKESNIAAFHPFDQYARGFHALVGEERFRGPHRVRAWMAGLLHLIFLLDPRTQQAVSEPRASNTKMIQYECEHGGHVEKLIDLPHKRAALVLWSRERFFQLSPFYWEPSPPV